jgi:hypothetical protein
MADEKKVSVEIEEMLTALGDPASKEAKIDDEGDGEGEETAEEKAARESQEVEDAKLSDEEKAAKQKEEDDAAAEAERLAEERKGETEEQKKEHEAVEAKEEAAKAEKKEKDALSQLEIERKDREKTEKDKEDARKAEEERKKKSEEPLKLEDQDFIGDLDLDDLTRDKTALNKILNAVYSKGVNDSKKIATEGVLNSIPDIVKHNLSLLTALKEASDNFYKENADLTPFKRVVATVFEEIAAKNPDKKYGELMNLVAPEARKRLELHQQAVKAEKKDGDEKGKPPRLHGVKGGQHRTPSQKPNTSALENEIAAMNKVIGR